MALPHTSSPGLLVGFHNELLLMGFHNELPGAPCGSPHRASWDSLWALPRRRASAQPKGIPPLRGRNRRSFPIETALLGHFSAPSPSPGILAGAPASPAQRTSRPARRIRAGTARQLPRSDATAMRRSRAFLETSPCRAYRNARGRRRGDRVQLRRSSRTRCDAPAVLQASRPVGRARWSAQGAVPATGIRLKRQRREARKPSSSPALPWAVRIDDIANPRWARLP